MIRWLIALARTVHLHYLRAVQTRIERVAPDHPESRRIRWEIARARARLNATWR